MRICFIHQNLPGQYRHLIDALLKRGDEVVGIGEQAAVARLTFRHPRLHLLSYRMPEEPAADNPVPAHLRELDRQVHRGQMVVRALHLLKQKNLVPDLVVVHPGWGEAMFVRAELPAVPMLGYCEFFYKASGSDFGFDPEFPSAAAALHRLQLRRMPHLQALYDMDAGVCPTQWQRAQFPAEFQPKLSVVHEGVDTDALVPDASAELVLGDWTLRAGDPIVTYVARNLEPYRGFHIFMRCLPALLAKVPEARVVIVGGDEVSYGVRLPPGDSYRARLLKELGDRLDTTRVRFTGKLPYDQYARVLQVSAVHAYLTYPFVLSWSLLEAMSSGCAVVASRTAPVEEVIVDGENGWLTDFFDAPALAAKLAEVLARRGEVGAVRAAARETVVQRYDLKRVCLPAGLALLDRAAGLTPVPR
ncbi:glycosyltransferase [Piscinibacter sp.]|uniref:glycosyltransferase n=1 Tax=Piscinibacter sp. TaxID=1903157 RepID=UPI00258C8AD2|nr:glycosyltransferase [Piscinibacter sp.]